MKIEKKIVGYKVTKQDVSPPAPEPGIVLEAMHENVARPEMLIGSTYKIKTPNSDHAQIGRAHV